MNIKSNYEFLNKSQSFTKYEI